MSSPPSPTCSDFSLGLRAMTKRGWSAGGSRNSWPNALSSARRKWICLLHTREGLARVTGRPLTKGASSNFCLWPNSSVTGICGARKLSGDKLPSVSRRHAARPPYSRHLPGTPLGALIPLPEDEQLPLTGPRRPKSVRAIFCPAPSSAATPALPRRDYEIILRGAPE